MKLSHILVAALSLVAVGAIWFWSSSGYGKISENAYELAVASYGACLAKSDQRIERIESMLSSDEFASSMTQQEIGWFQDLLADAKSERWDSAASVAKQMMQDQVEY